MNTLDLALRNVVLKKVAGTYGGEWQGPCPSCGGENRFHVWPEQNEGKGSYWCRGCGKTGDNIQYLRDFCGMSFRDACAELRIDLPDHRDHRAAQPPRTKPEFKPVAHAAPAGLWQEKAEKFIAWAAAGLANNSDVLAWLVARGINRETAINYRLGWNHGEGAESASSETGQAPGGSREGRDAAGDGRKDIYRPRKAWGLPEVLKEDGRPKALWIPRGLVIPYIDGGVIHRIRIRRPEGEPRYYVLPGSSMATMLIGRDCRAFVVVESELDAIAVAASNRHLAGAVALGSVSAKPDAEAFTALSGALQILNALDYDDAGAKAMEWWEEHFDRCDRWPVPQGKDPGDAFRMGIDLALWIKAGLPPALTMAAPGPISYRNPEIKHHKPEIMHAEPLSCLPPEVLELRELLRKNPGVKIINTPQRFTVLRDGKYVGGRINELVFRHPAVTEYLMNHPAEEIDGRNLII